MRLLIECCGRLSVHVFCSLYAASDRIRPAHDSGVNGDHITGTRCLLTTYNDLMTKGVGVVAP